MANNPPDRIYLQDYPGNTYWAATWCTEQIDDDDTEYLKATPEREAAGEMRAALVGLGGVWPAECFCQHVNTIEHTDACMVARAALVKARGEGVENDRIT